MTCPACHCQRVTVEPTPGGPHHAKELCADCRRFLRWVPKPGAERIRRPAGHRDLVEKFSRGFCQFCRRTEGVLPPGQTLEGHHIVELQDGGSSERDNILVLCTACHKLLHWMRTWVTSKESATP